MNDKSIPVTKSRILEGWTKEEKFKLLQAIKSSASTNLQYITECVESKTIEEVSYAIELYRKRAIEASPNVYQKKSKRQEAQKFPLIKLQAPLSNWVRLLTENIAYKDLDNETATALRLIAEFEELPKPVSKDSINYQKLYLLLANAIEGKTLPGNDNISHHAIEKCLIETALFSKSFIGCTKLNSVLKDMNFSINEFSEYTKPGTGYELAILRHLISQRAYNPLNVNEQNLLHQ